jgi:hypothetical protein
MQPTLRSRDRSILLTCLTLVAIVAGCGQAGSAPGDATPTPAATAPAAPLDCELEGYPCSLSEVAPAVAERSRSLGREAASRLDEGDAIASVAAWLTTQAEIKVVDFDGAALRFRVDGGRFVWLLSKEVGVAPASSPARTGTNSGGLLEVVTAYSPNRAHTGAGTGTIAQPGVVGEGRDQKRAIILSPYWFDFPETPMGTDLSVLLNATRGYGGGVSYLRNDTATSTTVDVNAFAHLAGNDFVYLDTIGGTICRGDADAERCYGVLAAHDLHGSDDSNEAQTEGLDSIVWWQGGEAVGLSGDFFRSYYPGGIQDALIFLGGEDMGEGTLIESLIGSTSEIYWWDGKRDPKAGVDVVYRFISRLAETGRTTKSVYHEMVDELVVDGTRFAGGTTKGSGQHTTRIREVASLLDPDTLKPFSDGGQLEVDGTPDDGESDLIPFVVEVEGVDPGDEDRTTVRVTIDGTAMDHVLGTDGTKVADGTWRIEGALSHGDVSDGQQLPFEALVGLPEGGYSRHALDLTVTGHKQPEIGRVWEGTAATKIPMLGGPGGITITVQIRLVRDPADDPGQQHVSFLLERGTMVWSIGGSSGDCSFSGGPVTVEMPETEFDVITFDRPTEPGGPITYHGVGEFDDGPSVTVRQDCKSTDTEIHRDADGTWFYAPRDGGFTLDGDTIEGSSGRYTWSFHRVE